MKGVWKGGGKGGERLVGDWVIGKRTGVGRPFSAVFLSLVFRRCFERWV